MTPTQTLTLCAAFFIFGLAWSNYQYKDVPKVVSVVVKSQGEREAYHSLALCKEAAERIVQYDRDIVYFTNELLLEYDGRFNGGRPIDQDRYDDLDKVEAKRDRFITIINEL